jgi:hypothetical protein
MLLSHHYLATLVCVSHRSSSHRLIFSFLIKAVVAVVVGGTTRPTSTKSALVTGVTARRKHRLGSGLTAIVSSHISLHIFILVVTPEKYICTG